MSLASSEEGQSGQSGLRMGLCSQRATDDVPGCQWWFGGGATEPSMARITATSFPERRSRWVPTYLGTYLRNGWARQVQWQLWQVARWTAAKGGTLPE